MYRTLLISTFLWVYVYGGLVRQRQASPSVALDDGSTIVGSEESGIDSFFGIPFAKPPIGPLRFKSPEPLGASVGTFMATTIPKGCPQATAPLSNLQGLASVVRQLAGHLNGIPQLGSLLAIVDLFLFGSPALPGVSEDCLTLNVYRPSSATPASKLPVMAYIYGGGFVGGSNLLADGVYFVNESLALGHPFIWVAMNYRLGGFGFLGGQETAEDGSSNLGLKDQRLALQWIQENVNAFGGDPGKVTLWGHSAGSISVMDQTIINRGNHTYNGKPLFRGAMMNSGTIIPAEPVDSPRAQQLFDQVVSSCKCAGAASKLDCLRGVPYDTLLSATINAPGSLGYTSIDFAWLPRPDPRSNFFPSSPNDAIDAGEFARIPVIAGDMEDEGTLFVQNVNITNNDELVTILTRHWAGTSANDIVQLLAAYPDDPSAGSPFRTGNANNIYPEYKRLAAIHGDTTFTLMTRKYLSIISGAVDAYSYIGTFLYNTANYGTPHSADYAAAVNPTPGFVVPRDAINLYYASFVNFSNPNMIPSPLPTWVKYTQAAPLLLNYSINALSFIPSDFRQGQYEAIEALSDRLRL